MMDAALESFHVSTYATFAGEPRKAEPLTLPATLSTPGAGSRDSQHRQAAVQEDLLQSQPALSERSSPSGISEGPLAADSALPAQPSSPAASRQSEEQALLTTDGSSVLPQRLACLDFLPLQRSAHSSMSDLEGSIAHSIVEEHLQTMQMETEIQAAEARGIKPMEEAYPSDSAQPASPEEGAELSSASEKQMGASERGAESLQKGLSPAENMPGIKDQQPASDSMAHEGSSSRSIGKGITEGAPEPSYDNVAADSSRVDAEDSFIEELDKPKDPEKALPPLPGLHQISLELPVLNSLDLESRLQEAHAPSQEDSQTADSQLALHEVEFEAAVSPKEAPQPKTAECVDTRQGDGVWSEREARPGSQILDAVSPVESSQAKAVNKGAAISHEKASIPTEGSNTANQEDSPNRELRREALPASAEASLPKDTEVAAEGAYRVSLKTQETESGDERKAYSLLTAPSTAPASGLSESGLLLASGLKAVEAGPSQTPPPPAFEATGPQPQTGTTAAAAVSQDADGPSSSTREAVMQPVTYHPLADSAVDSKESQGVHFLCIYRAASLP